MTFDLKSHYGTDPELEVGGVWEDISEGARLLIARVGNEAYQKRYRRVPRGIRNQISSGVLDDKVTEDVMCRLLADTILLDWEGISDDGKEIKHSKDKAYEMLRSYRDFRDLVWDVANDQSRFRDEDIEETKGNLKASSIGKSLTGT